MKRIAVFSAAVSAALAVSMSFTSAAYAQTRTPTKIEFSKACGTVTLTFTGAADSGTHGFRWNAVNGSVATGEGSRTGTVTVSPGEVEEVTITFPEDEFSGVASLTVGVFFGPNSDVQPSLDIFSVDTDCVPSTTSAVVPTPTSVPPISVPPTSPPALSSPTLAPVPATPAGEDVNCPDVSDVEAQALLDADPSDPFDLDRDNDGIACVGPEVDDSVTVVPNDAPDTGDGSTL